MSFPTCASATRVSARSLISCRSWRSCTARNSCSSENTCSWRCHSRSLTHNQEITVKSAYKELIGTMKICSLGHTFFIFCLSRIPAYFFKKWKKNNLKFIFLYCRPYENGAESEKNETNWVRNYNLLCKERSPWEKSLKSQLWLYSHTGIYFSIVAICFVEMELCLFVYTFLLRCSVDRGLGAKLL